jgi:hypothetical protein
MQKVKDHVSATHKLLEHDPYPIAPGITVIPAKAGIH